MNHVCPSDALLESEICGVVRNHTEIERIIITFLNQLLKGLPGLFRIELSFSRL